MNTAKLQYLCVYIYHSITKVGLIVCYHSVTNAKQSFGKKHTNNFPFAIGYHCLCVCVEWKFLVILLSFEKEKKKKTGFGLEIQTKIPVQSIEIFGL